MGRAYPLSIPSLLTFRKAHLLPTRGPRLIFAAPYIADFWKVLFLLFPPTLPSPLFSSATPHSLLSPFCLPILSPSSLVTPSSFHGAQPFSAAIECYKLSLGPCGVRPPNMVHFELKIAPLVTVWIVMSAGPIRPLAQCHVPHVPPYRQAAAFLLVLLNR